jgi:UDP-N-acetylmuramoylalanine-D-glutamate ligase
MPPARSLSGVRVLIWGLGRHGGGLAAARLCRHEGAEVAILDAKPAAQCGTDGTAALAEGFSCHVGDPAHPAFRSAELIVPSPAIPPRAWPASHPPVASPEDLAFERHRGRRVGVTGTKGKSTTAMLTGALLGWGVAGNSWRPLCEAVLEDPEADLVCELSSFQLWYLRDQAPHFDAAILTLLATDHLDWHPDIAHYRNAKLALLGWAGVVAAAAQTLPLLPAGTPLLAQAAEPAGADLRVPGPHNRANAALALAVARHLGAVEADLLPRLRAAEPLPHRLRTVHVSGTLAFVDDSIATTPEAAMAGLASFAGPLAIILGGSDKGADFAALAAAVASREARPILLGATAERIRTTLAAAGIAAPIATDLDTAIRLAIAALAGRGTVLLSPACASFDLFRGFDHRGDCFAEAAKRLAATA